MCDLLFFPHRSIVLCGTQEDGEYFFGGGRKESPRKRRAANGTRARTDSERRQHLTKIDLPGCCWIFLFQLPFAAFFPLLFFFFPSTHTHTLSLFQKRPSRMEISVKNPRFCCCRLFSQIEGLSFPENRVLGKNSLHFRWLRFFLHDLIRLVTWAFYKAIWHHWFSLAALNRYFVDHFVCTMCAKPGACSTWKPFF